MSGEAFKVGDRVRHEEIRANAKARFSELYIAGTFEDVAAWDEATPSEWAKILHEKIAELQPPLRVADFLESTPPTTNGHWLDAKEKLAAEASKLNERLWKDPDLRPFGLMTKGPRTVVVGDIIHADYGHQEGPILHGAERAAYIRIAAGIDPPPTPPEPPPTCVACSDTGYIPGLAVPVVPCPRCGR